MKKIFLVIVSMIFLVTTLITGCGAKQEVINQDNPASENSKQEIKKFNVGYLATPGHVLYFVAKEKGYFLDEGLDVEMFLFTNSGEGLNALKSGKINVGSFGTAAPLTFISKGAEFTIFGGQQTEGHGLIARPEKADQFKELTDYKGKTIATVRLSTGDVVFRGALLDAGIDWKKDLTINELDSPAAVLEAVKKGSVDAGIVWTPYIKMAENQGLKVVQYSGDLAKLHTCCRQVALTSNIKEKPQEYEKFTSALIKAYKFYQENKEETVEIISKYVKIDKDIIKEETYGGHIFSMPDPDKLGVIKFWNVMNKVGYIQSDLKIENFIDTDIYKNSLDKILKENPEDKVYKRLKSEFKH